MIIDGLAGELFQNNREVAGLAIYIGWFLANHNAFNMLWHDVAGKTTYSTVEPVPHSGCLENIRLYGTHNPWNDPMKEGEGFTHCEG